MVVHGAAISALTGETLRPSHVHQAQNSSWSRPLRPIRWGRKDDAGALGLGIKCLETSTATVAKDLGVSGRTFYTALTGTGVHAAGLTMSRSSPGRMDR